MRATLALVIANMRRKIRVAAVLAVAAMPTTLIGCHESRPTEGANDNVVTPGALLPAAPQRDGGASGTDAGAFVDAGASAVSAPLVDATTTLPSEPRTPATAVPPASLKAAVAANNAFASALFGQVRAQGAGKNFFTSPISATLALSMAYAGAQGRTRTEMATVLHIGSAGPAIFEGQNALSQALLTRGPDALSSAARAFRGDQPAPLATDYTLQIVNSVWGEASYQWQAPFLHTLAIDYGAGVTLRDFRQQSEGARLEINRWVSRETANKINDLLPSGALGAGTRLVLVNALHLKFPWDKPFNANATADGPFTRSDRTEARASFMHQQAQVRYVDDGSAQIVALPLAGQQLTVIIALPHVGVTLSTYERSLRVGSPALSEPKSSSLVALALPKLTFTSGTFSLAGALRSLGMTQAFDPKHADFEGMCLQPPNDERPFISDVLQKTMIAMQETGVEAAAATAVVMMTMGAVSRVPPPVPIPMIVNRPYLIAIVDAPTGAVLMLGQVNDPTDGGGG